MVIVGTPRLMGIQSGRSIKAQCFPGEAVGVVDLQAELWLESLLPCGLEGAPTWESGRPRIK